MIRINDAVGNIWEVTERHSRLKSAPEWGYSVLRFWNPLADEKHEIGSLAHLEELSAPALRVLLRRARRRSNAAKQPRSTGARREGNSRPSVSARQDNA